MQALKRSVIGEQLPSADVPTASAAMLTFESGAIGTMSSSCLLDTRHQVGRHMVAGGLSVELVERSLLDRELRVATGGDIAVEVSHQDPIEREDREFVDALLGRVEGVRMPYADALRTQLLVSAADRSAQEGTPVVVADVAP